ncbi:reverse transcriptase [Ancylostoma duodenale]|uniref:RNA-directed DNA polymerase n=1 Tax=Ancylostoma duodenale TaxID=51022 RepID=A0A0C2DH79_9BILA|nr:reverse transcriptase [Ancylostoma duodenale]
MMVAEVKAGRNDDVAMKLKKSYPEVFEEGLGLYTKEKADLQLVSDVRPVFKACRPVPHAAVEAVEKELDRLLEMNVITPVTHSEWAAPIVCLRKSNGKLRVCADFSTGLNKALESFDYPLPVPGDIFATLNEGAVFLQIDLSDAYLQIELSDESKKMVVINTHRGLFQYNRLPFGIKTAPGIFQQVMNKMVAGLRGVATYLDDILVCGRTEQEHMENLLASFERIAEYGFNVRIEKCSFAKPEIRYLGFIVDRNGRRPNPEKIEAIKSMVEPKNVGQLRAFLGMMTYYAAFMPTMKDFCGPLDALLKKDVKWEWTSKQQTAFEKLKKALSSELNLAHYDPRQKIVVAADACDYGIGCVISHRYADDYDFECVCKVLDYLNIECNPVLVYRLGRPQRGINRLTKVVLPARMFQRLAVKRAPRLRFFCERGIYLRPSLTLEERKRRKEERNQQAPASENRSSYAPQQHVSTTCVTAGTSTHADACSPRSIQGN